MSQITQEIWIASYLTPPRFKTFKKALKSFNDQTLKAPVVLSVCGPEAWRAKQWAYELLQDVQYEIFLRENRYSQFDQLFMISKSRPPAREHVYLSVCDDDDYFYPERIQVQQTYLNKGLPPAAFRCQVSGGIQDFGSFCFDRAKLDWFFSEESKIFREMNKNIPPDVLFSASLPWHNIPETLLHKEVSLQKTWNEDRDNSAGDKWFTITLLA